MKIFLRFLFAALVCNFYASAQETSNAQAPEKRKSDICSCASQYAKMQEIEDSVTGILKVLDEIKKDF